MYPGYAFEVSRNSVQARTHCHKGLSEIIITYRMKICLELTCLSIGQKVNQNGMVPLA